MLRLALAESNGAGATLIEGTGTMVTMLTPLIFALAAILALVALAATWIAFGKVALANIAALRTVKTCRDYEVRIGRHPALVGSTAVVAWPRQPVIARPPAVPAGLRAAA